MTQTTIVDPNNLGNLQELFSKQTPSSQQSHQTGVVQPLSCNVFSPGSVDSSYATGEERSPVLGSNKQVMSPPSSQPKKKNVCQFMWKKPPKQQTPSGSTGVKKTVHNLLQVARRGGSPPFPQYRSQQSRNSHLGPPIRGSIPSHPGSNSGDSNYSSNYSPAGNSFSSPELDPAADRGLSPYHTYPDGGNHGYEADDDNRHGEMWDKDPSLSGVNPNDVLPSPCSSQSSYSSSEPLPPIGDMLKTLDRSGQTQRAARTMPTGHRNSPIGTGVRQLHKSGVGQGKPSAYYRYRQLARELKASTPLRRRGRGSRGGRGRGSGRGASSYVDRGGFMQNAETLKQKLGDPSFVASLTGRGRGGRGRGRGSRGGRGRRTNYDGPKRGPGRPKGSLNKKTLLKMQLEREMRMMRNEGNSSDSDWEPPPYQREPPNFPHANHVDPHTLPYSNPTSPLSPGVIRHTRGPSLSHLNSSEWDADNPEFEEDVPHHESDAASRAFNRKHLEEGGYELHMPSELFVSGEQQPIQDDEFTQPLSTQTHDTEILDGNEELELDNTHDRIVVHTGDDNVEDGYQMAAQASMEGTPVEQQGEEKEETERTTTLELDQVRNEHFHESVEKCICPVKANLLEQSGIFLPMFSFHSVF